MKIFLLEGKLSDIMKRPYGRAVAIARLSLIAALPYNQCTADLVEGTSRGATETITSIYERNMAKMKELADFWRAPEERIKDYVLREQGIRGIDRR